MSKLIDKETFAMVEGVQTETALFIPFSTNDSPTQISTTSGANVFKVSFENSLTVADYKLITVDLFVAGMTKKAAYNDETTIARLCFLDASGNEANAPIGPVLKQTDPKNNTDNSYNAVHIHTWIDPNNNVGVYKGDDYYLGVTVSVQGKQLMTGALPTVIGGIALRTYNDSVIYTCGAAAIVTAAK